ncbi:insulinase family protein [Flavobacterium sp. CBA20B-1]|uniref:M16 family metallopeptidase n=1 Tax=unclassified Flavobacterium TaxID=196869 RepID=UPI00222561B2|nr:MULTISPECIES: insulinase family protein [unclassified Flavobacterium]WCM41804.1 insulinase family protein [Flavobacterium sp. CBA20B-1]
MNLKKLTLGLLILPASIWAQVVDLNQKLPTDPDVRIGKLDNGLTYYIRKNGKPEKKVDLRLVLNAGSILETDKQVGLAHFMEHMVFNGTKTFPKNELISYLQSIGVKFGQHLNAYTSFDETVYFLPIPSDDPVKLDKGFQILEDWAFNANLDGKDIDDERGVVIEEYRTRLGANERMMKNYLPKMLYNSMYAKRLPIGTKENLETFKHEEIRQFYKDWYRPNLMAVIVVGDINVDEMEAKIKSHFGKYKNPANPKERKSFDIPNHKETFISVNTDKEATSSNVQIFYKDNEKAKPSTTVGDYKKDLIEGLFSQMLNARLEEYTNDANPPFVYGYSFHGSMYGREKEAFQSMAMTGEDKQLEALRVLAIENERAKRFGFTQSELERAKTEYLAFYEKAFNDKDKNNSSAYLGQYQGNFLEGEAIPSIDYEYNLVKDLLPTISLKDVNNVIQSYIKEENRVIILTGPEKEGLKTPTEKDVLAALDVSKVEITPYEDAVVAESLIRKEIKPGKVTNTTKNDKLGTTTLTLSNGAKVTYKKTDFKNDEIVFGARSFGGFNLIDNETYKKIQHASGSVPQAGIAGMDQNALAKFNTGKLYRVSPYVGGITEGFSGNATPKDLEFLFQSVHAYFTDLNYDEKAFESEKNKTKSYLANIMAMPEVFFQIELSDFMYGHNARYSSPIPTEKDWDNTDYKKAYELYKERFADASDFEFFFVGNVTDEQMKSMSEKYIASLPALNRKETPKDTGFRAKTGIHKKEVFKGTDDKASVRISYGGETTYSQKENLAMQALGEILTIKLIEELREKEGGVYGAGARGSLSKLPYGSYDFSISYPTNPKDADKLIELTLKEVEKIQQNGPDAKDLDKFKEGEMTDYTKSLKENKYWLGVLTNAFSEQENPEKALDFEKNLKALTVKDVQEVAKKYLTKNRVIAVLKPETAKK